jgi:hypothetical protein
MGRQRVAGSRRPVDMVIRPEALIICVTGIALGLLYVPRMLAEGLVDVYEAAVAGGALLILSAMSLLLYSTVAGQVGAVVFVTCVGLLPYGRRLVGRRMLKRLALGDLQRWKQALEFDPRNASAHFFAAKSYRSLGRLDEAIASYEGGLSLSRGEIKAQRDYEMTVQLRRRNAGENWICAMCRAESPPERSSCFRCGTHLPQVEHVDTPLARYGIAPLPIAVGLTGVLALAGARRPEAMVGICCVAAALVMFVYVFLMPDIED